MLDRGEYQGETSREEQALQDKYQPLNDLLIVSDDTFSRASTGDWTDWLFFLAKKELLADPIVQQRADGFASFFKYLHAFLNRHRPNVDCDLENNVLLLYFFSKTHPWLVPYFKKYDFFQNSTPFYYVEKVQNCFALGQKSSPKTTGAWQSALQQIHALDNTFNMLRGSEQAWPALACLEIYSKPFFKQLGVHLRQQEQRNLHMLQAVLAKIHAGLKKKPAWYRLAFRKVPELTYQVLHYRALCLGLRPEAANKTMISNIMQLRSKAVLLLATAVIAAAVLAALTFVSTSVGFWPGVAGLGACAFVAFISIAAWGKLRAQYRTVIALLKQKEKCGQNNDVKAASASTEPVIYSPHSQQSTSRSWNDSKSNSHSHSRSSSKRHSRSNSSSASFTGGVVGIPPP